MMLGGAILLRSIIKTSSIWVSYQDDDELTGKQENFVEGKKVMSYKVLQAADVDLWSTDL